MSKDTVTVELPKDQMRLMMGFIGDMIGTLAAEKEQMSEPETRVLSQLANIFSKMADQLPEAEEQ